MSCQGPPDIQSTTQGAKKITNGFYKTVVHPAMGAASKITERRAHLQTGYASRSVVREVAKTTKNANLRMVTKVQLASCASMHGVTVDPSEGGQIYAFEPASHEWFNVTLREAIARALPKWQVAHGTTETQNNVIIGKMTLLELLLMYCVDRSSELRSTFKELFTYPPEPVVPTVPSAAAATAGSAVPIRKGKRAAPDHGAEGVAPPAKKRKKRKPAALPTVPSTVASADPEEDDVLPDLTEDQD
jgi:hypothetical protein